MKLGKLKEIDIRKVWDMSNTIFQNGCLQKKI